MNRLFVMVFGFGVLALLVPGMSERVLEARQHTPPAKQATQSDSQPIEVAKVSTGSGEVRLKPDARGHYVADFKMNGRTVTALVDTGASSVAINRSTARRLGLNVTANDFIYEANTANGIAKMAITTIREIQIGRIIVRNVEAAVLEDKALNGTLLGMSFLRQLDGFTVSGGDLILKQ
ncbi:MAG: retropepsin-like aspartic protease family protein [Rhizobiaceae bacterium]